MPHNSLMACFSVELGEVKDSATFLYITCSFCSNHLVLLIIFLSVKMYYYANTFPALRFSSGQKKTKESQKKPFFHAWVLIMRMVISLQPFVFMSQ